MKRWHRLRSSLFLLCVGLLAKVAWVAACAPSRTTDTEDISARRGHLLERTLSPTYTDDHTFSPGGIYASEWQLVTLSMTAAALTNLGFVEPSTRAGAVTDCASLIEQTLQPEVRAFELSAWGSDPLDDLDGPNGHVGYLGHLNLMLGAYRVLGGDGRYQALHRRISHAIARRMRDSASWHLQTYPGRIYTADNSVGVASLALYDLVTGESHREELDAWVAFSREHLLDPDNGLVVFAVSPEGEPLGRGRGSAAGYNSFYLPFVDEVFAAEQRRNLRAHMVVTMSFGAIGVREYARGVSGTGDVDTGPLFFGVSPSATGFAIAGARHDDDAAFTLGLLRTAEIAGFTVPCPGGRCYALAPLVGDAIVLAMRTATRWDRRHLR